MRRHDVLRARVFAALDEAVPEASGGGVDLLLDTPCDMVDEKLGRARSDESLELRQNYVYEWAKERGVKIHV